jgi:cytosine/uracil/thiamine/allantoin permease
MSKDIVELNEDVSNSSLYSEDLAPIPSSQRTWSKWHLAAMIALLVGVFVALIGYWVPALNFLYSLSWFTGFIISFILYIILMKNNKQV